MEFKKLKDAFAVFCESKNEALVRETALKDAFAMISNMVKDIWTSQKLSDMKFTVNKHTVLCDYSGIHIEENLLFSSDELVELEQVIADYLFGLAEHFMTS